MRLGPWSSALAVFTVFLSGGANACLYHDPGRCGSSMESSVRRPLTSDTPLSSDFAAAAFPTQIHLPNAGVSTNHGRQQGYGSFGFQDQQGGPIGAGSSPDQLLSALFNPLGPTANRDGLGGLSNPAWQGLAGRALESGSVGREGGTSVSPTPLPPSWTMMLIWLGVLGLFAGSRQRQAKRAARSRRGNESGSLEHGCRT